MRIDEASKKNVAHVLARLRESDVREFLAISHARDREELAELLLEKYQEHPNAMCALTDDGEPVAIGAMLEIRPKVATLLFFATDRFQEIARPLTRFVRQQALDKCHVHGVHRIECVSIEGYEAAHRWIKAIGLQEEAVMPGYGREGETFRQFAWVRDDVR